MLLYCLQRKLLKLFYDKFSNLILGICCRRLINEQKLEDYFCYIFIEKLMLRLKYLIIFIISAKFSTMGKERF